MFNIPMLDYRQIRFTYTSLKNLPAKFAIIALENASSSTSGNQAYANKFNVLDVFLQANNVPAIPLFSCTTNMCFWQENRLLLTSQNYAEFIAKKFSQSEYFWVEHGKLGLISTHCQDNTRHHIGLFQDHLLANCLAN